MGCCKPRLAARHAAATMHRISLEPVDESVSFTSNAPHRAASRRRGRGAAVEPEPGARAGQISEPADHADRAVAGRRLDRPAPARAGRDRRQAPRARTSSSRTSPAAAARIGPGTMALTAKPDGYTIAQYPMGMLRVPHMQKVQWHPLNDFTFIIGVSGYTFGFTVRADSPYKTFNEYIEAARKAPGKIDYGSTGIGTSPHLLMEEVARQREGHAEPHAVQGQRRPDAGAARRPRDGAERRHRLGQVRRRRPDAPARHLRREAHQALAATCRPRRSSATTSSRLRRTAWSARRAWTRRW